MVKYGWFLLLLLAFFSCKKKGCDQTHDVSKIQLDVTIDHLEEKLFQIENQEELGLFLDANPLIKEQFFSASSYPSEKIMLEEVFKLIKNPYTDSLYQDVKRVFKQGEALERQLESAFKRIKYYYPEFEPPKVRTVVSGFGNDVYLTDSLIIIGLDYFLTGHTQYKPDLYDYFLQRMTPAHLVPSIIMHISNRYNHTDLSDRTMLSEMVFYGKAYQFTKKIMPCVADSLIVGYTHQQMADSEVSETYIWSHFVENALIYEKSGVLINKYIGERPSIPEIAPKCPGRIGRWLGWKVIQAYERKTGDDIVALMKETDTRKLFMQSKYRPQRR